MRSDALRAGFLLSPAAVEPHAHLDKAFLADAVTNETGDLFNSLADDADVPWGLDSKYDVVQNRVAHRRDLAVDIVEKTK